MKKYEYISRVINGKIGNIPFTEDLNKYGKDSWELIMLYTDNNEITYGTFKREILFLV